MDRLGPPPGQPLPRWVREAIGIALAVAIAVVVVAVVAASARSELLFRDGDSLVTTLLVQSLVAGRLQDWALSTVLFLPETAVLWMLSTLGLGVNGTLALAGVVNLVALYGAFRVAAGATRRGRAPVAGALLALVVFGMLARSQTSPDRDTLELASLLVTTTYYSATVIAAVVSVGMVRRALDRDLGRVRWGLVLGLGALAAASVLTNPLFAAWATVPLVGVLGVVGVRRRSRTAGWLGGALVTGSAVGFVARMPLSDVIANTGAGYADVTRWAESLVYYGDLVGQRWSTPEGAVASALLLLLWLWCGVAAVLFARRGATGAAVVAACGWVLPMVVAVGAIVLGTHAARYVQPVEFAPLLGLVVLPEVVTSTRRWPRFVDAARGRTGSVAAVAGTMAVVIVAVGAGIPRIAAASGAPDRDLDCVVTWVEDAQRTGAGQFWTVRLPKTHLDDPRRLVQVDHQLRGYAWLVDRDDFAAGEVSFLVLDAQSPAFDLPGDVSVEDAELTSCGRYTIADFGERALALGPQRS